MAKETKRVNKSKEELQAELQTQQENAFREALMEIESKHGFKLEPILHFSVRGVIPQITMVRVPVEKIEIKPTEKDTK